MISSKLTGSSTVERLTVNQEDAGSNPALSAKLAELTKLRYTNLDMWLTYGSELCAGGMHKEEDELVAECRELGAKDIDIVLTYPEYPKF